MSPHAPANLGADQGFLSGARPKTSREWDDMRAPFLDDETASRLNVRSRWEGGSKFVYHRRAIFPSKARMTPCRSCRGCEEGLYPLTSPSLLAWIVNPHAFFLRCANSSLRFGPSTTVQFLIHQSVIAWRRSAGVPQPAGRNARGWACRQSPHGGRHGPLVFGTPA
jgi:hypothetical protein